MHKTSQLGNAGCKCRCHTLRQEKMRNPLTQNKWGNKWGRYTQRQNKSYVKNNKQTC